VAHAFRFRLRTLLAVLALVGALCAILFQFIPMVMRYGVGRHQRAITEELVLFEQQCTEITDRKGAAHAIAMLDYVQNYYVPSPGYRGTGETERSLESQRTRTMRVYATALEDYCGESHDFDVPAWHTWLAASADTKDNLPTTAGGKVPSP